jgi:hypothetical protein
MIGIQERRLKMSVTQIQILAGIGAIFVVALIIWRRKAKASKK